MRPLFPLLCLLPAVLSAQTGDAASVAGTVANAISGEPLRKATLTLRSQDMKPGNINPPPTYTTTSDASGAFAIVGVPPGNYRLSAARGGFVGMEYGARTPGRTGKPITLAPGQTMRDIALRLTPMGVVTGRVLDEDGDPVRNAMVQASRFRYNGSERMLMSAANATTNDLGEYRLFDLVPGNYYVAAQYRQQRFNQPNMFDRSPGAHADEEYVPTYYPGTTDPSGAVELNIPAGGQVRNNDLVLRKAHTVRVRGRVIGDPPGGIPRVQLTLMPRNPGIAQPATSAISNAEGDFELVGVLPGSYILAAHLNANGKTLTARRPLEVGSANLEDVALHFSPGVTVAGRIRVDGDTKQDLSNVQVQFGPFEPGFAYGPYPGGKVNPDLSFQFNDVASDRFAVSVSRLPEGFFVKAIRSGSVDVKATGLEVAGAPPEPLDILLSPRAGQITGTVQTADGRPVGRGAMLVLAPKDSTARNYASSLSFTSTGDGGSFSFRSLPPGAYVIYAWEDVEPGAWYDPDFMKTQDGKGTAVTIQEGGRETVEVTLIPAG